MSRFLEWWRAHTRWQLAIALGVVAWLLLWLGALLWLSR